MPSAGSSFSLLGRTFLASTTMSLLLPSTVLMSLRPYLVSCNSGRRILASNSKYSVRKVVEGALLLVVSARQPYPKGALYLDALHSHF